MYLVFEYTDTDVKKYIKSFRADPQPIPSHIVKVSPFFTKFFIEFGVAMNLRPGLIVVKMGIVCRV